MSVENEGSRYVFEFSGNIVECVIAPIPKTRADEWLVRESADLLQQVVGSDSDIDESDTAYLGRASDLPGAVFLVGCELKNGRLSIRALKEDVASFDLESEEFWAAGVDDVQEIEVESYLIDNGPTLITRTIYNGTATYETNSVSTNFEDAGWYVFVANLGYGQFISKLAFEGEDIVPEVTGSVLSQEVWLLVPDNEGGIQKIHQSSVETTI